MIAGIRTINGEEYSFGTPIQPIECFRCGICCIGYHPKLTEEEFEAMAEQLSLSTNEFIAGYVQVTKIGYLLRQTENGCIFLTWEKGTGKSFCSVHPFRPAPCRDWVPSLSRRECREGLTKLQENNGILLVDDIYEKGEQRDKFYASLREAGED